MMELRGTLIALSCCLTVACGDSAHGPAATTPSPEDEVPLLGLEEEEEAPEPPGWKGLYWVNSNSGPTFAWELGDVVAEKYVAAPLNGQPLEGSVCQEYGGTVAPGLAAKSMYDAIPAGATFELWMRPKKDEFSGTTGPIADAVEAKLAWFEQCVRQDWPDAPDVAGLMCVHEVNLGGDVNCTNLAAVFEAGVNTPSGARALFGVVAAPQSMARTDVDIVMGEMYEPAFFPPSDTCPASSDGDTYGSEIATYLNGQTYGPGAVPAFGGPSATCQLDYSAFEEAANALGKAVTIPLAGLGVWS